MLPLNIKPRLESKYIPEPNTGCWLWTGAVNNTKHSKTAYGILKIDGKHKLAHRLMYEMHNGPIDDGLYIDHRCNNTYCVNPEHLQAISPRENVVRSRISTPGINARKTHCAHGHPLFGDNLISYQGHRHCRACARLRQKKIPPEVKREYRKKHRAKIKNNHRGSI
jgi:hypothetical protein